MRILVVTILCTAIVALRPAAPGAQEVSSQVLVERAAAYLRDLFPRLSNLVAEEQYLQETTSPRRKRTLLSDYLIVQLESGDFAAFRDVFQVDGKAVRDRDERLQKLFIDAPAATAVQQAQRIAEESARHNIWNIGTINTPYLSVAFIQDLYRPRFRLQSPKREASVGPDVYAIQYEEILSPTILKGNANADLPSRGRWWIEASTGHVVKTELRIGTTSATRGVNAIELTTTFKYDEALALTVPVEMKEFYPLGRSGDVRGSATYSRFRRFGVTTTEEIAK